MFRYSDFFVTVNTHKDYDERLYDDLRAAINALKEPGVAARLFDVDEEQVRFSRVSILGIELAPNPRKKTVQMLHAHFTWELKHSTTLLLGPRNAQDGKGINARLQEHFNNALDIEGTYCNVQLDRERSASKNYARKTSQEGALPTTTDDFDIYGF